MEILPSVKTQYSTIPSSLYSRNGFNNWKRKTIFNGQTANPIFVNSFRRQTNNGRRLVLQLHGSSASYDEGGAGGSIGLENMPLSVDLEPISSESQFDRVVAEAQQLESPLVVLWMASWCRKCIYLKPKLEKFAADYYPRIKFYSIDVNNVPHKLVVRAGVTKMPTIQLWKDGKNLAEVIGGHKAYLVVNEVREMIDNENSL